MSLPDPMDQGRLRCEIDLGVEDAGVPAQHALKAFAQLVHHMPHVEHSAIKLPDGMSSPASLVLRLEFRPTCPRRRRLPSLAQRRPRQLSPPATCCRSSREHTMRRPQSRRQALTERRHDALEFCAR